MVMTALAAATADAARGAEADVFWPMFGGNPARDGNAILPDGSRGPVDFGEGELGLLWASPPPEVVYSYNKGATGSSPILVTSGSKPMLIVGSYDRHVYGYNALTGEAEWQFTTGDSVIATPCYARVNGREMVFVASSDRIIYALDPATGKELSTATGATWRYEVYPWSDTVQPAVIGDPMVADVDGRPVLFLTVFINDLRSEGNVQQSALYALDPAAAKLLWKAEIGAGTSAAPSFGKVNDEPAVFCTHDAGALFAFSARDGRPLWQKPFVSQYDIRSAATYAELNGRRLLYFGSRLYSTYCIDADTKDVVWNFYAGTWIDSTPAIHYGGERPTAIFGDYQKTIHATDAHTGAGLWHYKAYGHFCSSPVLLRLNGSTAAAMPCLDDHLYIVNAETGGFMFRVFTGKFLWTHYQRGDTIWPSAAAARLAGRGLLAVSSYDGRVYVFGVGGKPVNLGPPRGMLLDAFGGSVAAAILAGLAIAAGLVYSGTVIVRKVRTEKQQTRRAPPG